MAFLPEYFYFQRVGGGAFSSITRRRPVTRESVYDIRTQVGSSSKLVIVVLVLSSRIGHAADEMFCKIIIWLIVTHSHKRTLSRLDNTRTHTHTRTRRRRFVSLPCGERSRRVLSVRRNATTHENLTVGGRRWAPERKVNVPEIMPPLVRRPLRSVAHRCAPVLTGERGWKTRTVPTVRTRLRPWIDTVMQWKTHSVLSILLGLRIAYSVPFARSESNIQSHRNTMAARPGDGSHGAGAVVDTWGDLALANAVENAGGERFWWVRLVTYARANASCSGPTRLFSHPPGGVHGVGWRFSRRECLVAVD